MAFDTPRVQPVSTYRIAPTNNRLQRNIYGNGYSEYMDYSAIDALPNPGYGATTGMPAGGPGNQDTNVDVLVQRMTDVLQDQLGLSLRTMDTCIHLPSQNGTTGWHYLIGLKFPQSSPSFQDKMIPVLWNI
jgi:hypothetical protein